MLPKYVTVDCNFDDDDEDDDDDHRRITMIMLITKMLVLRWEGPQRPTIKDFLQSVLKRVGEFFVLFTANIVTTSISKQIVVVQRKEA